GAVDYATALFERATVERYVGYLRRVLDEMVADDAKQVHRMELLDAAERGRVVEEWNRTDAEYPADTCIHELFQAQVQRTPDAVALSYQGERLTYAELNARANQLAHHLRSLGVGPEVRVAVFIRRGIETVVSLLAVLKAGGGYVPFDVGNPDDRHRYTLADSTPAVVLTGGPPAARLAGAGVPLVDLGDSAVWEHPASDPDRAEVGVGPEHLAYVIYTSGSTGRPKGVLVRHGSLVNLLVDTRAAYGVGPGDVLPALASSAFDISLFELLLPLVSGAELRLVAPTRVMDARALLGEITDATLLHAVPALMRDIAQVQRRAPSLPRLRATFVGGEQVPADLLAEMSAAFPAARTHILYGPTEATILASAHAVPADGAVTGHPIGRPLGNVRLYVCDTPGEPQPVGVAGELLIGGVGVSRGYLGRPALTAERFVPDPFSAVPGARLYRSGDRARWVEVRACESARVRTSDGRDDSREADSTPALSPSRTFALEFLGRTDFQVKIRGFRIELGEIEARLREHPAVRQAVVLAREDAPGRKRLVAYVVAEAPADALKAHLEAGLPGYMVPAAYVRLEALPLTSNGKVDRKALPAPDADAFAARAYEAPLGETETTLAAIWSELLGVERVGRGDDFFALGGHSLLAVRLISRLRQALGVEAAVRDVFVRPVLADFARGLETAARAEATAIVPVERSGPLPLSFAQQRLWFIEQMEGVGATYHIPMRLRLRGELDRGALVRALDRIVARHEALRTTFPTVDGEPVQHIAPVEESGIRLVEHDLRASADAEDELRRLVQEEAGATFDLAQGPLVRGRLIRMAADDNVLLLTMHHIVSDGWSAGVLSREMAALYAAFTRGEPDPLPPRAFVLPVDEIIGADDDALGAALAAEGRKPFDLAEGPPFRARLFRLGAEDHALIVTLHHVVGDAWSFGVLFRELGALY
ncbi:MAG TPA: amino acid adenylation domain-containing protein, partial [Longimicrobium sp.]|nr:amino acid adenylation domain-containing protein [Longimicrobium sp.]